MNNTNESSHYCSITPSRQDCIYTSCYCEENVWKLCEHIMTRKQYPEDGVYAVFISNERKMVSCHIYPCFHQVKFETFLSSSSAESKMNLDDFISMDPRRGCGSVYTLTEFVQRFAKT
nr:PREDICTED: protein N-terminal glutamine amidohydrolase [Lepisosteus oculatus]